MTGLALRKPPWPEASLDASVDWTPASFFRPEGERLVCTLCPHACRLADGEVGACEVRRRRGALLETATRSTAIRHLDPIEKKPFFHFRPGLRALTLASPGCSFTCHYCLNYRLSQFGREGGAAWRARPVDASAVVAEAQGLGAAIALSYSEPSLAGELTMDLAAAAHGQGVDILWKSNGFLTRTAIDQLAPCLAAVNVDLKASDDARHRALTGAPLAPVLATIARFVAAGVWVEVSTPLIPKINNDETSLRGLARGIRTISADIPWHLLRFTPDFRMRRLPPTPPEDLRRAAEIGRAEGLRYVYVERALGEEGRATCCPACGARVVSRGIWSTAAVLLVNGECPDCGCAIAGRW